MASETKPCVGCGQLVRTDAEACTYCKTPTTATWGAWSTAQASRCDAVDFNGVQCGLQAGHSGKHGPALTPAGEGMTDWKKFALLIFALVAIGAVAVVWMYVNSSINAMI